MADINIVPLEPTDLEGAVATLTAAFKTNPVVVQLMKQQAEANLTKIDGMHRIMLGKLPGDVYVAKDGNDVAGVMRVVDSTRCQPSLLETLRVAPSMLWAMRAKSARAASLMSSWGKHDPKQHHVHLGPIGILPDRQGQGVGSALMQHYLGMLDAEHHAGYLETDRPGNVGFYERFGFKVIKEVPALGIPTWLMWRDAQ